jgi:hypothetical protein
MSRFGGKRFAFVKNKNIVGARLPAFTPTFAFNESVSNANITYTCNLSTNLPNTTVKYNIGGTIDDTEFLSGSIRTQNIVLDTNGNATISFTANTAVSSASRTFRLEIMSPGSNALLANTNFHTISGNVSNGIQIIPAGSNTYQQSDITVGATVYTLYEFNANVGTISGVTASQTYDISSVLQNGPVVDVLAVGGGGASGAGGTGILGSGGGGGGGAVGYFQNTVIPNKTYNISVGLGGSVSDISAGATLLDSTENIGAHGGKRGQSSTTANTGGDGGQGGGLNTFPTYNGNGTGTVSLRNGGGGGAGWGANVNGRRGLSTGSDNPLNVAAGDGGRGCNVVYAGDGGDGFSSNITNNLVTYGAGGGAAANGYSGAGFVEVAVVDGSGGTASGIDEVDMVSPNFDLSNTSTSFMRPGKFRSFTGTGQLLFNHAINGNTYSLKANVSNSERNEMYQNNALTLPSQSGVVGEVSGTRLVGGQWYVDNPDGFDGEGWGNFGSGGNIQTTVNSVAGRGHDGVLYIRHPKNGDRKLTL